jgi:dolichyl-phosphate beta-glucosyltransferase
MVLWSPPPIITHDSEKKYRSHLSPVTPVPLSFLDDQASVDLSVVIPAYNETARLPSMLASTIDHLASTASNGRTYEIIIVDDGSTDNTAFEALEIAHKYPTSDIKVVVLEENLGKGGAVRHGMLFASGSRLLMVDADGASRFEDLELLWKAIDELAPTNEPAVAVGSRAHLVKTEAVVKVCGFLFGNARVLFLTIHSLLFSAIVNTQRSHVRTAHDFTISRCGSHQRHAMWV